MLGRRSVVLATLVSTAAFGGGAAAFAATHGSHPAKKPAVQPVRISNMHYGCHHHDTAAATPPL